MLTTIVGYSALVDVAAAGPVDEGTTATKFATTDAADPYLWLEEIDGPAHSTGYVPATPPPIASWRRSRSTQNCDVKL